MRCHTPNSPAGGTRLKTMKWPVSTELLGAGEGIWEVVLSVVLRGIWTSVRAQRTLTFNGAIIW